MPSDSFVELHFINNRKTVINLLLFFFTSNIQAFLAPVYCIPASLGFLRIFQKSIALKRVTVAGVTFFSLHRDSFTILTFNS